MTKPKEPTLEQKLADSLRVALGQWAGWYDDCRSEVPDTKDWANCQKVLKEYDDAQAQG